jgi:Cu2+-exporting ATPase
VSAIAPLPALLDYAAEMAKSRPGGGLALVRAEGGRAHVRGATRDAEGMNELLEWLAARADVVHVEHRERLASLEIEYRESPASHGEPAFVVSLRDQLFTLTQPAPARPRVQLVHALDGRVRFRVAGAQERGADDDAVVALAALLAEQPGVRRAKASPVSRSVLVEFDPGLTTAEALHRVAEAGLGSGLPPAPAPAKRSAWGHAAMNSAVLGATLTGLLPLPALAAAVSLTALPSARRALTAARERRLSVDVLDLAAIGISLGTGQPVTAAFITWLLGIGDVVLEHTQDRARGAISKLMKLDTDRAFRIRRHAGADHGGEQVEEVSAKKLAVGDLIVVDAGSGVAADGVIVRGVASVDEKALTGESIPRERRVGDKVLAATVVLEGQIVVEVERTGRDTTAAKIVQILEGAGAKPMTLQRETERTADRLVLPTIGLASGAAMLAQQIDRMTSVLITDFGTGIRIAVPTSALTAMTLAARQGVLVKGAQYLERLAKADAVVFDKTGTLTSGSPEVFEVAAVGDLPTEEALRLAAGAESRQAHPIADAIREHARRAGLDVAAPELGSETYAIGLGLSAKVLGLSVLVGGARLMSRHAVDVASGHHAVARQRAAGASSIYVAVSGKLAAVIGYRDEPRPESAAVVKALQAGGRRQVVLMSGDARASVEAVARAVGADRFHAEMLPEDKAAQVRALQKEGRTVAMVGDGINDAPALALADVGISLHGGTDVALETADVVLLDSGLAKLPDAFEMADDAMRRVRRGLGYVIAPNAVAIVLGAVGLLAPGGAALINNGSTVVASLAAVAPLFQRTGRRRGG